MSRKSKREAEKRKTRQGWWVTCASILVLLVVIVVSQMTKPDTGADHCPLDGPVSAQVAVLVDASDALTAVQRRSSLPRLLHSLEQVPERAEIRVYSVARIGRTGDAGAELRLCVPPHPDSIGGIEGLWMNKRIAERKHEEDFTEVLEAGLDEMLGAPGDSVSPIVEAIQAASVDAFQPGNAAIPRTLILVSDMVQNSRDLSFYPGVPGFGSFAGSPEYRTRRVDLSGVGATILQLARRGVAGQRQAGRLQDFWEDYFIDSGVDGRPRWVRVEG